MANSGAKSKQSKMTQKSEDDFNFCVDAKEMAVVGKAECRAAMLSARGPCFPLLSRVGA